MTAILIILLSISTALYNFRNVQDVEYEVTVIRVDRRPEREPHPFYAVFYYNGGKLVLDRKDLTNSDEVWKSLQDGQKLVFHHRAEFWRIFGRTIMLRHRGTLRKK